MNSERVIRVKKTSTDGIDGCTGGETCAWIGDSRYIMDTEDINNSTVTDYDALKADAEKYRAVVNNYQPVTREQAEAKVRKLLAEQGGDKLTGEYLLKLLMEYSDSMSAFNLRAEQAEADAVKWRELQADIAPSVEKLSGKAGELFDKLMADEEKCGDWQTAAIQVRYRKSADFPNAFDVQTHGCGWLMEKSELSRALASRPTGFTAEQVNQMVREVCELTVFPATIRSRDSQTVCDWIVRLMAARLASAKPEPVKVIDATGKSYEECRELINAMHGGPVGQTSGEGVATAKQIGPVGAGEKSVSQPPSPDSIDVGEGFYRLAVGTKLEEGDEKGSRLTFGGPMCWRSICDNEIGVPINSIGFIIYRRKLPAPAPVPSLKGNVESWLDSIQCDNEHCDEDQADIDSARAALLTHIRALSHRAELAGKLAEAVHAEHAAVGSLEILRNAERIQWVISAKSRVVSIIAEIQREQSNG